MAPKRTALSSLNKNDDRYHDDDGQTMRMMMSMMCGCDSHVFRLELQKTDDR